MVGSIEEAMVFRKQKVMCAFLMNDDQVFTAKMNLGVVAVAFLICTFVGVIFGFIPAFRAAKSDPIESLRFE